MYINFPRPKPTFKKKPYHVTRGEKSKQELFCELFDHAQYGPWNRGGHIDYGWDTTVDGDVLKQFFLYHYDGYVLIQHGHRSVRLEQRGGTWYAVHSYE